MKCDFIIVVKGEIERCGRPAVHFIAMPHHKMSTVLYCRCDAHEIFTKYTTAKVLTEDEAVVFQMMND
jgi:hypothetical protein